MDINEIERLSHNDPHDDLQTQVVTLQTTLKALIEFLKQGRFVPFEAVCDKCGKSLTAYDCYELPKHIDKTFCYKCVEQLL